jgi:S1-C subfamily serine protease
MRIKASLVALALTVSFAGCAHAQQPGSSGERPGTISGSFENPRPPAASLGFALRTRSGERPVVSGVQPGSPAAAAGFLVGDEILTVDGRSSLDRPLFPGLAPGRKYRIRVKRGSAERELELTAGPPS